MVAIRIVTCERRPLVALFADRTQNQLCVDQMLFASLFLFYFGIESTIMNASLRHV
jgi:hypothetical protein